MTNPCKMLITGISGMLGGNLAHYFRDWFQVAGVYHTNRVSIEGVSTIRADLADFEQTRKMIDSTKPEIVIHCASLTSIDDCESDQERANRANVQSTENLVNILKGSGARLVFISSDSVYDGENGNYKESDPAAPRNHYGRTKQLGEDALAQLPGSLALRTNIFGYNIRDKKSLAESFLATLQQGGKIKGFTDAVFSSIYTFELARVIDIALQKNLSGLYNCGGRDSCSKHDFAVKLAELFGLDQSLISKSTLAEHGFKAPRGKNLSLDVSKLENALSYRLPTIDQSLDAFYRDYHSGLPERIKVKTKNSAAKLIPYGRQCIDAADARAVVDVLMSDRITQGPKVAEFEKALADYCGAKYAVAVNSGTSGLHIACLAAGVGPGDEVVSSPITFVASTNCAVYCGAKPVFSDIEPKTYLMSTEALEKTISAKTKAVVPVHHTGQSCEMVEINRICKEAESGERIFVIEDASHALGSEYRGDKVGGCRYSDMAVMSFHPVKHVTTGEGGAVLTNDEELYQRLLRFRSHGITNTAEEFVMPEQAFDNGNGDDKPTLGPWYYEQQQLGFNYRITDIQCALGISQMKKLDRFVARRRKIVDRYNDAFRDVPNMKTPFEADPGNANFHLYVPLFDFKAMGRTRTELMGALLERKILTQVHYIPVHIQPYYQEHFGTGPGDFPAAEEYYSRALSLPLYPSMTDEDVECVIETVMELSKGDF